jgi:hypothetical protein
MKLISTILHSLILFSICSLLCFSTSFAQFNFNAGLVAYYPFNGNANDESGNGNNGTVNGATLTTDRFGNANNAYLFNGSTNYITVPYSNTIGVQNSLTISAWIFMDGGTSLTYPPRVLQITGGYGHGGDAGYDLLCWGNSNVSRTFQARYYNNDGGTNIWINPTSSITSLTWHHLVFCANGSTGKGLFYVDGVLTDSTTGGTINSCNYNGNSLYIGTESTFYGYWGGKLDDIRIYNRALSDVEVYALYNSEKAGLIAYYPFNGNANDESGNGHNGTVNGPTLTTDRFGIPNRAYYFNGSTSFIQVPHSSSFDFASRKQLTFSAWIKVGSWHHTAIVFKGIATTFPYPNEWSAFCESDSTLRTKINKDSANADNTNLSSSSCMHLNKWSLFVMIWDGNSQTLKMYLDTQLVASSSAIDQLVSLISAPLYFGYVADGQSDCIIDDICIYNRTLSEVEIRALYNFGSDGLIAYYPFNGNADDESGNGNNGTVNGATLTTDRFGNANSAYSFDGTSSYINIPTLNNFQYSPVTYSLWIKADTLITDMFMGPGWGGFTGIIGRDASGNTSQGILVLYKQLSPPAFVGIDNKFQYYTGATGIVYNSYTLPLHTWFHVVYTSDETNKSKLYVNDQLILDTTFTATQNANINFNIGSGGGRGFWKGSIDDIRIYNRAISVEEIHALPVTLTSFTASIKTTSQINLAWKTTTEVNNYGFEVQRRIVNSNLSSTADWIKIGFVQGSGTSNSPKEYSFIDANLSLGQYVYRLKQFDNDGSFKYSQSVEITAQAPKQFTLGQNFPNPYNPSTTIQYGLPARSAVRIVIYNILGQVVKELINSEQPAGIQSVVWNASASSGLYFYRLEATSLDNPTKRFVETKKMLLLK